METVGEVLVALAGRYSFAEVAALVEAGAGAPLPASDGARIDQLCAFGQRLLDLDAEDFGNPDAAADANVEHFFADLVPGDRVPAELVSRARACRVPQRPREKQRGALGSLRPVFRLLLEVIEARWRRRETAALVSAVHITSEYLPLLVWEQVLGHAGDPARLAPQVSGDGSRWGDPENSRCPHTGAEKAAAQHAVRAAGEPVPAWRAYLDRRHSLTSHAFAVCAGRCDEPCTVLTRHPGPARQVLRDGCRTALAYADSPIVALRHFAPVGHGFGVPSPREVLAAWERTRTLLGTHQPAVLADDGYPLPGLPSLFGALAGVPLAPDTLVAATAAALVTALGQRSAS